ncbi:hypothetical protein JCM31185_14450, partial [Furfurilactobacillus curtus]
LPFSVCKPFLTALRAAINEYVWAEATPSVPSAILLEAEVAAEFAFWTSLPTFELAAGKDVADAELEVAEAAILFVSPTLSATDGSSFAEADSLTGTDAWLALAKSAE